MPPCIKTLAAVGSVDIVDNSMEVPQETKNRTTI